MVPHVIWTRSPSYTGRDPETQWLFLVAKPGLSMYPGKSTATRLWKGTFIYLTARCLYSSSLQNDWGALEGVWHLTHNQNAIVSLHWGINNHLGTGCSNFTFRAFKTFMSLKRKIQICILLCFFLCRCVKAANISLQKVPDENGPQI